MKPKKGIGIGDNRKGHLTVGDDEVGTIVILETRHKERAVAEVMPTPRDGIVDYLAYQPMEETAEILQGKVIKTLGKTTEAIERLLIEQKRNIHRGIITWLKGKKKEVEAEGTYMTLTIYNRAKQLARTTLFDELIAEQKAIIK